MCSILKMSVIIRPGQDIERRPHSHSRIQMCRTDWEIKTILEKSNGNSLSCYCHLKVQSRSHCGEGVKAAHSAYKKKIQLFLSRYQEIIFWMEDDLTFAYMIGNTIVVDNKDYINMQEALLRQRSWCIFKDPEHKIIFGSSSGRYRPDSLIIRLTRVYYYSQTH